jgi:hypothetical protein
MDSALTTVHTRLPPFCSEKNNMPSTNKVGEMAELVMASG